MSSLSLKILGPHYVYAQVLTYTHSCTFIFVRTLVDMVHSLDPYPDTKLNPKGNLTPKTWS